MPIYPEKLTRRLNSITSAGTCPNANAIGTAATFECGCVVRIRLAIASDEQRIEGASFASNGCGYAVAAAEILASELKNRRLTELHGMDVREFHRPIVSEIGEIPDGRLPCMGAAVEAAKTALNDYRSRRLEEFSGEKALICTCFGVSEEAIEEFISADSPKSVEDVVNACRAGGGCGSCRPLIQEMLDSADELHQIV